jgi:hypothetical protein
LIVVINEYRLWLDLQMNEQAHHPTTISMQGIIVALAVTSDPRSLYLSGICLSLGPPRHTIVKNGIFVLSAARREIFGPFAQGHMQAHSEDGQ